MKKKIFSVLMVCAMVLGLVACGGNEPVEETVDKVETETTVETEVEDKTLVASGITVDGEFGAATSVSCAEVTNGDVYDAVVAELAEGSTGMAIWNIDIIDAAGTAIQPDGNVTITLNLPDSLISANGDTYTVYRQEGDGTQTVLPSEVKGNTIVFATEHFSIYTVVKTDSQAVVEEDSEVAVEDTTENEEVVSEEVVVSEEPVAPKTEYTYSALDKTMYAKSSVNVRDLPSTDGERIGGLSARQEVHVTGQCNETGWYRIAYGDGEAYVSNSYIVAEKPAEPQPEPEQPTQPSGNYDGYDEFGNGYVMGADGYKHFDASCPYPINQITDGGSWVSYYGIVGQPQKDTDCKNILEDRYPGSFYDKSHLERIELGYYKEGLVTYKKWFY